MFLTTVLTIMVLKIVNTASILFDDDISKTFLL